MKDLLTIVFIGFDGYSDLWDDCMGLFRRFWPGCPYEVLFVDNTKEVSWPGVKVLHAGADAEWSRKVQLALANCHTPYMCLLLEDYLVGKEIDKDPLPSLIQLMQKYALTYYQMGNIVGVWKSDNSLFRQIPFVHIITQDQAYGISLQPAIWDVNYLSKLVGTANYNAWKFEFARVKEAQGKPHLPAEGCVFDTRNILNLQHGVVQSKYLPDTVAYFKKRGIALNIKRPIMSWPQYYKRRLVEYGKAILPHTWRGPVKHVLEKFGMKFVSTVRDK